MNYSNSSNEGWTYSENKQFENAIAELDLNSPKLFENIKAIMPWKTVEQIQSHYEKLFEDVLMIERGEFGSPDYAAVDDDDVVDAGHPINRKGVPWTEEEHRLFLIGLKKLGKGEWRDISRYYVPTKTTSQVASHAQKYFRRLKCSTPLKKRRFSIHDIRILNSKIVENSPRNPSLHVVLAEIPPHSLHPSLSPHHKSFLQDNRLINHYHNNNFIVVQKHFSNSAFSSVHQQVVTANNNVIIDDNDNTAPTTVTGGGGGGSGSSCSKMIMRNNNTNTDNDNHSINDDVYSVGYVDQYAYDADLLCAAAVSPFWFPPRAPPPNHNMPFY